MTPKTRCLWSPLVGGSPAKAGRGVYAFPADQFAE